MRDTKLLFLFAVVLLSGSSLFAEEKPTDVDVTQISLERSGGKPGAPRDTLILHSDGTAAYVGVENVANIGEYRGRVPDWYDTKSFPQLAEMYRALMGAGLSTGKPTPSVTTITLRVTVNGEEKEIVDLCPGLDERLWGLEMAVRGVAADITWEKQPVGNAQLGTPK